MVPDDSTRYVISIHALREEGDVSKKTGPVKPCFISIHALREEGDAVASRLFENQQKFLSTPSARRATGKHRRTSHPQ